MRQEECTTKKTLAALMAAALLSVPVAMAEEGTVYEAENAQLNGKIAVSADAKASGGTVVGRFEGNTDTVSFTITVPADGMYDLTFTSKGIGGGKYNNVLVDGQDEGQFKCSGTEFEADTLRGILMTAGEHTVTITPVESRMLLVSAELQGPYRNHRGEESALMVDVPVALETVTQGEGVVFYPQLGITSKGEFLDEAQMAQVDDAIAVSFGLNENRPT